MKNFIKKKPIKVLLISLVVYAVLFGLIKTNVISTYYAGIINLALINIVLAVSLNLIVGFTGQLCLGHAGFMSIGAYISAILTLKSGLPVILAILIGAIIASMIAALIGYPILKLTGDYFAITTLAFCEIIRIVIMNIDFVGGARGLTGIPVIPEKFKFTLAFIFAITTIIMFSILLK